MLIDFLEHWAFALLRIKPKRCFALLNPHPLKPKPCNFKVILRSEVGFLKLKWYEFVYHIFPMPLIMTLKVFVMLQSSKIVGNWKYAYTHTEDAIKFYLTNLWRLKRASCVTSIGPVSYAIHRPFSALCT